MGVREFYYHVFVLTENLSNSPSTPAITLKKASKNVQGIKKVLFLIHIHYHKIFQLWWKLDSQLRILG